MYTKYGIKSYPDNKTYIDQKRSYNQNRDKNYTNSRNEESLIETAFQPKCIFTKQNDNLSFYQSSSKNSFINSKIKNQTKGENITPITKEKNTIYRIQNPNERNKENIIQNFQYNYSDVNEDKTRRNNRTIKNNINNINININPNTNNYNLNNNEINPNNEYQKISQEKARRINLDEHIMKSNKRKRMVKSCKRQYNYNVQKRDDFNVLSYKQPEDEDSDMNFTNFEKKKKIIKIYKKQGVDEIFFPSKRTHSPNVPTKRKKFSQKYQTHTLKYQSFFGSINSTKPEHMIKSLSRKRINQLNDFNIDKLIEIGDKYAMMKKPVLPLGQIMNNNILCLNRIKKNKYQIPINTNNNCFNYSKYSKRTFNKTHINQNNKNKENIPLQNRVIKKLITKNKIKKSKLSIDNEEKNNKMPNENTVRKYLNFKNENQTYTNMLDNNAVNSSVVIRRRNKDNNNTFLRKQNSFDKNMNMNDLGEEIPKRKFQKITGDLRINSHGEGMNANYIILNKNRKIMEINNDKKEKIITDENNINRNYRNSRKKIDQNNREILIDINVNKKFNKYKNIKTNQNKTKNYYGYDDRHNLEDTINNHSYYESLHSNKRKENNNNNIYDKGV